ncbi:MAG: sporulation protein [Acidimicrobiia bacterium]|nr:sporulation protein [Acidimicrobiia bacterium]
MDLERLHTTIEGARDAMTVARVYGDPIERDGVLVIPAASVRGGGGGGGGEGVDGDQNGSGQGFGVGMDARPVGAFVVRGNDVRWEPAIDRNRQIAIAGAVAVVGLLTLRTLLRRRRR